MTRRLIMVGLLVALAVPAGAQYSNWFWNGYIDYPLPPPPCASTPVGAVPMALGGRVWLFYTCANGEVWARDYYGTPTGLVGGTTVPQPWTPPPVTTPPSPTASCPTIQPGPDWRCVAGNWLPPQ